jgi:cell division protein FtsW (lipid II flippase)
MVTKTNTQRASRRFLRRTAVVGSIFFTAVVVLLALAGPDSGTAIRIMTPIWMVTMFTAVGTYAAGSYLARRTASVQVPSQDRATATA